MRVPVMVINVAVIALLMALVGGDLADLLG
jgi:hypothetical protein